MTFKYTGCDDLSDAYIDAINKLDAALKKIQPIINYSVANKKKGILDRIAPTIVVFGIIFWLLFLVYLMVSAYLRQS